MADGESLAGVHEWFTSRLGNCFYCLLYSREIGIGIGEGGGSISGRVNNNKSISGCEYPFFIIFNLLLDFEIYTQVQNSS